MKVAAVTAAAIGPVVLAAGDLVAILSLVLSLLVYYAGRRDVLERAGVQHAELASRVATLTAELDAVRRQQAEHGREVASQGRDLATLEAELHHRPTISEVHVLLLRR